MKINVMLFGQIAEITGSSTIVLNDIADTNKLIQKLHSLYPALANTKYVIAVDRQMINENILLHNNNAVALLPPFSGG